MAPELTLSVNGSNHSISSAPDTPLLYVLRNTLRLTGPRFGCGLAQCGACAVLVDGRSPLVHHAGILRGWQAGHHNRRIARRLGRAEGVERATKPAPGPTGVDR